MRALREVTAERNSAVPLRVDCVVDGQAELAASIYCTDIEGTELLVAIQEPSTTELPWETGGWYRFDGVVRSNSLGAHLLLLSEDGSAERIDPPERQAHPPLAELDAPWLVQLGASDDLIAMTVQPRPTDRTGSVCVEDPETFEIGAVCFADCDQSGDTTVYHREEPDTRDEHLLLEHVVEDISGAKGATLATRRGSHAPLEMLYQRLALASGGDVVAPGAEQVLHECFHANPENVAVKMGVDTLSEAAHQLGIEASPVLLSDYDIGIDPAEWRENWESDSLALSDASDPQMTNRDYTTLIERYLGAEDESVDSTELAHCLKSYASADLGLLRELVTHGTMDKIGCQQLSGRLLDGRQSHSN